jgi:NMD protein affecting ribosome stability and mRNA decay
MKPTRSNAKPSLRENPRDRRRADARREDLYPATRRPTEPTVCPTCQAVFSAGRWTWDRIPEDANEQKCPACQRIHDAFPAGYVMIKGAFIKDHRDEIVAFIKGKEKVQKASYPLQRIMAIEEVSDGLQVSTTDSTLARGIGEALHDAYKGELKLRYSRDENLLRATWKR